MSSTSRGGVREASDYYFTPREPIREFIAAFRRDYGMHVLDWKFLDPCAGGKMQGGGLA